MSGVCHVPRLVTEQSQCANLATAFPVTRSRYDSPAAMWMAEREDRSQAKLFRTEPVPSKADSGRLFDARPSRRSRWSASACRPSRRRRLLLAGTYLPRLPF